MLVVVVTGPPGSGKSLLCRWLQKHPHFRVIHADDWVKQGYHDPDIQHQLVHRLGMRMIQEGQPNVLALVREWVLKNPLERLSQLESVIHPYLWQRWQKWVQETPREQLDRYIWIYEAPLYFEAGSRIPADFRILVVARKEACLERVKQRSGYREVLYQAFWQRQWPLEKKILLADYVVWNESSLTFFSSQVIQLQCWIWASLGLGRG